MDAAKKEATIAIEAMLVAEKDANDARLKAAAAAVAAEKVKKATEVERYAEKEAKSSHKDAKKAEKEAKKKYDRIYNACLLDKSSGVDLEISSIKTALKKTCESIAEDPSWLESLRYNYWQKMFGH